jgi:hypothetical protein
MQRTAEEFVHELPDARWFVGDFVRTDGEGHEVFLVEPYRSGQGVELRRDVIARGWPGVHLFTHKRSAKRAAQQMIERVLDEGCP